MYKKFLIFIFCLNLFAGYGFPPYFYDIKSTKKQKKEFIKILKPLIEKANKKVLKERDFVKRFFKYASENCFRELDPKMLRYLVGLYKKYKIKHLFDEKEYLKKIDMIPISLALAQGAIESAWGRSRFVKEANNIFGHWTYKKRGIVPSEREEGKTHKIRIFNSLQESVDAYVLNLNRNKAYELFRDLRYEAKKKKRVFDGLQASKSMINYSQLKDRYVKLISSIIKKNGLSVYDNDL